MLAQGRGGQPHRPTVASAGGHGSWVVVGGKGREGAVVINCGGNCVVPGLVRFKIQRLAEGAQGPFPTRVIAHTPCICICSPPKCLLQEGGAGHGRPGGRMSGRARGPGVRPLFQPPPPSLGGDVGPTPTQQELGSLGPEVPRDPGKK